jgi:hypothetical protein
LYRAETELQRERYRGACQRVRGAVAVKSSKLQHSKTCQRLLAELRFLRDENKHSLAYIDRLLLDGQDLRRSLNRRERVLNCRESIVRGYISYLSGRHKIRSIATDPFIVEHKPICLDEFQPLTTLEDGDLNKSRLLCSLVAKITEVASSLTQAEEAVNRCERSLINILEEARSSRLKRFNLREAEIKLGSIQGSYQYLLALTQGSVKTVDTAYDSAIIDSEYGSLRSLAAKRDAVALDLTNLLQLLPEESRESLPSVSSYNSQL